MSIRYRCGVMAAQLSRWFWKEADFHSWLEGNFQGQDREKTKGGESEGESDIYRSWITAL